MRINSAILFAALLCFGPLASASAVTYQITVDTSSIPSSPDGGSFEFQFNPGPMQSQAASLQILNFSSDGVLRDSPVIIGNVSGSLPLMVTFDNGASFNDYFQGFTYGSTLSFKVVISGPALDSPDGVSTSGSLFAFSLFSDALGTTPVPFTEVTNGLAFIADVNLDGMVTLTNYTAETTISAVPIPAAVWLFGSVLGGLAIFGKRSKRP